LPNGNRGTNAAPLALPTRHLAKDLSMDVKANLKNAADKVADMLALGTAKAPGEMDILDKLKQEHDEVKELLSDIVGSDSAPERRALLKKIKAALVPHTKAEEKIVYDAVIAAKGVKNRVDGAEGYLEHELATKALLKLNKIGKVTSPEFTATAKVLKELVNHHVQEEERNIWSDVRENFDSEARIEMNRRFEAAKKKVRIP
jgi:hemerythrin superfamily protein